MYDVIVIGGGPAGIMASISALKNGKKVLLIERNEDIAVKLKLTGGGRCNITNNKSNDALIKQVHNGKFLFSSLFNFGVYDIIALFKHYGVELKEEDNGRMFPTSEKSIDIINVLKKDLNSYDNFKQILNESVLDIVVENGKVVGVITDKNTYKCDNVVLATGGNSYPNTGSDGNGFVLAKKLGHSITEIYPTETSLVSNDKFIQDKSIQGLSLKNVGIKTNTFNETGYDIIFTHFGLSGPAILRASASVYFELKNSKTIELFVDIMPNKTEEELLGNITKELNQNPKKAIKNVLNKLIQSRFLMLLFEHSNIDKEANSATVSKEKIRKFVELIKSFKVEVCGVKGFNNSFVTGGGVALSEVDPKSMQSKLIKGLYFAGEILDLHAHTGGYNITIALTTGHTAGSNI